jgi:glucokinase
MAKTHILVGDLGGTNFGVAIFAHLGGDAFEPVVHRTFRSRTVRSVGALLGRFLKQEVKRLDPPVRRACIDFAGPVTPGRTDAWVTNLNWGFSARDVLEATGLEEIALVNDFEAVGYGLEVLIANQPRAFARLSRAGRLPRPGQHKLPAVVIGAGTGLGTSILVEDRALGRYRPVSGEGGHADFVAVEEPEFRVAQWIRKHRNHSRRAPLDCETIVSGRGLANVYEAMSSLEPERARPAQLAAIRKATPYERPARIVEGARTDPLCRSALDFWLRAYGRAAKNCAIFPLAPGGVFLAGGIAAKILPEMQSGIFMKEFNRCDVAPIRALLRRTPVWVVTDYRIGLYGCANVAVNFFDELGVRR